jgi:hypothetical protein
MRAARFARDSVVGRSGLEEPDHRHRRLLRARRQLPRGPAAEKRDELAAFQVEQPTKFELVINMKAAKSLGLTIPQSVQVLADEIIAVDGAACDRVL